MTNLIAREVVNGMWFVLSDLMLASFVWFAIQRFREHGFSAYFELGTQAAIALAIYLTGSALRAGYIWLLLHCQNDGNDCSNIEQNIVLLASASVLAVVGGVCCIRIFSPPEYRPWSWLLAGALSLAIPAIAFFF